MIQLFHAFLDEVAHRGVKGLAELIAPQLGKAVDFFQGVREKYARRKALHDQKAEAEKIARMSAEQVVADIREEVARAFPDQPKLREELELYLSLVPGAVQRTLRGKHDPKGLSAPAGFALDSPEKVAAMFPDAVPTLRPNDPVPGREEKYRLVSPVGGGGFGEVWKAADRMTPGHFVAVKVFPDPNIQLDVIRHEYRQALRLNDPVHGWPAGVVPVVDAKLDGEHPWIMYEFVGGGTLAELIVQWQTLEMPDRVREAVAAMKSLAGTCAHLHGLNPALVHRDLKPANVLGTADALRITDLGLGGAAVEYELATESQGYRSVSGRLPSLLYGSYSLNYASPEQRRGNPPDPRDDIHALGVIAYQMLTGKLDAAPSPRFERELKELAVPQPLIDVIGDCVDGDASRRPRNAAALVEALDKLTPKAVPVAKPVRTPVVNLTPKPGRDVPKRKSETARRIAPLEPESSGRRVPILALGSLLLVGVVLLLVFGLRKPPQGSVFTNSFGNTIKPPGAIVDTSGNYPGQEMTLPIGTSGVDMTFCWCPPGMFQRGGNEFDDEKPVREITISKGFWMAKTETTQAQWKALGFKNESHFKGDTLPVENVSHTQAVAFADKLKTVSGKPVRLPTEAEWEYACRAGTPAGQKYWSGNTEEDLARVGWCDNNSERKTHPVGEKKANPWGLHDMHGNVWEWCADWYDAGYYAKSPKDDPTGPENGEQRVYRGGAWYIDAVFCRSAARHSFTLDDRSNSLGFRLAVVPSGQ